MGTIASGMPFDEAGDQAALSCLVSLDDKRATNSQRFGPKGATLARLKQAGLPVPMGLCLSVEAYRMQLKHLGLEELTAEVFHTDDTFKARMTALKIRKHLYDEPICDELVEPLREAWCKLQPISEAGVIVRSSALMEDLDSSSFAGQFESFLGITNEEEFFIAVRSCWAALWSVRVLRYMATHEIDPSQLGMAVLCQPLVHARASGGGLSQNTEHQLIVTSSSGLGTGIAQGEVTPDRFVISQDGEIVDFTLGHGQQTHSNHCTHGSHHHGERLQAQPFEEPVHVHAAPSLTPEHVKAIAQIMVKAEALYGRPVEIEWAADQNDVYLVQTRSLLMQQPAVVDDDWPARPRLTGHPAGIGIGSGRACIINCECQLSTIAPGDILITRVAGPSLSQFLPQVAGVVAELGGSTSHLASLARERGIPMVLGVPDATSRIPANCDVLVDGVTGTVRWKARSDTRLPAAS